MRLIIATGLLTALPGDSVWDALFWVLLLLPILLLGRKLLANR
jgi:hypothetical protein